VAADFWTAEKVKRLSDLWENHHEITAERIADQLGATKNMVIGKARRLGLERETLSSASHRAKVEQRIEAAVTKDPFASIGPASCRWPHGNPGQPEFHFCGAAVVPDRPYCDAHCAKAYISAKRAREIADQWTAEKRATAKERFVERQQRKA
jgi:GcrA cell cycle regulator